MTRFTEKIRLNKSLSQRDHNDRVMSEQTKPVRRRIVPQQIISPTKPQSESEANGATAVQVDIGNLKDHSALAAKLLGPGRKLYVDLVAHQKEQKPVNWKGVRYFSRSRSQQL